LKPEEDAFGQMMWAYYKGKEVCEIVERDDGYFSAHRRGPETYFSEHKNWPLTEQEAMKFANGRVLDIGCGAGRHSLYLQKKGFDVLGIDSSPLAVKICKLRGLKKARVMSLEDANFEPDSFDTVIMLGGNFGLFGTFTKARKLIKRFHKMSSKNALIIAETRNPYKTNNLAHLKYHKLNKKRGRMSGQARIRVRFQKTVTEWFDWLMVSKEEMQELLKSTGWNVSDFLESENSRYTAIIRKLA
jgi:cyclopropane fatty-acyl-phospholipid synthase-like methyltransferase